MAVAQESEFLAVNQKIRVRIPAVTPFHSARDAEIVEAAACKPALTRCESGRALHFGAIVQEQDDAMALRRSGCDSPWLHHLEGHNVSGHEEDSNPCRSDRRTRVTRQRLSTNAERRLRSRRSGKSRGSTEVPDHFNSAKALVATHAAGIGERPVQLRLADHTAL